MTRVLILVPSLGMGGMERVCVNYANLFCQRGFEVSLYNLTSDNIGIVQNLLPNINYKKNLMQKVPNCFHAGVPYILEGKFRILPAKHWLKYVNPKQLYKRLVTENVDEFDIEIAFYGGDIMRIIKGSCQKRSVKIGWIHAPTIESHYTLFFSKKDAIQTYRAMNVLMCVSNETVNKAKELFGDDVNAHVLYNPNNVLKIRRLSQLKITDIKKRKYTFINVSRIELNTKGFDRLIMAVHRLNGEGFDFDMWILGEGKDLVALKELISQVKLENVFLLGEKENPYAYMAQADCYVCASRTEGFSMVVAEALILGLPVISTEVSGAKEMLGDSEYGLVVENSVNGIYQGMYKILTDTDTREWIKSKAELRKDFLSEASIMDKFEQIVQYERESK